MTLINPEAATSESTRQTSSYEYLATPAIHLQSDRINTMRVSSSASDHISTAVPLTVWKVTVLTAVPQVNALKRIFFFYL
jgi:hypothetical protein